MPVYARVFRGQDDHVVIARAAWKRAISHLEETGNLTAPRIEIADRYARACAEYEVLYPTAVEEGPVRKGPNGGDVFNFNWSAVEKLNDRLAKFEAKLGMDVGTTAGPVKPKVKKAAADEFLGD